MPDLTFRIGEVAPACFAAVPAVLARLHIVNAPPDEAVRSIALNCQVRIQPLGRAYSSAEELRLFELFGEREQWARSMTPLVWTQLSINVPGFTAETVVDLSLPCSMDFDIAACKYFHGLEAGSVNASVLFSGSVFYLRPGGALEIVPIPWDREARFSLPVSVWKQALAEHYGDSAWLRLPQETFDRLYRFRLVHGITNFDRLLHDLMNEAERSEAGSSMVRRPGAVQ